MIEIMPESRLDVVGVRASGTLTDTDYKQILIPKLDALFEKYGTLDLLFYMDEDFKGWDREAAWDDAFYGLKHRADFGKLAVVGGPTWVEWSIKLSGFLMKGEVKLFPSEQLEQAWEWVRS